jgi:hypothetical protein
MTLYITRNGQRLGPYTIADAQQMVAAGTLQPSDWAWYEGLTDWIPLQQVPGFVAGAAAVAAPAYSAPAAAALFETGTPTRRPVMVWVICLLYFISIPLGVIGLIATPYLMSFSAKMQDGVVDQIQGQIDHTNDPGQKERLTASLNQIKASQAQIAKLANRGAGTYVFSAVAMVVNLVASILLFMLRRAALPAFACAFVLSMAGTIYNFYTMDLLHQTGTAQVAGLVGGLIGLVIGWGIAIAILWYVWSLSRRGVLR